MPTRFYPVIVLHEAPDNFGIVFPDLPGCVSAGDSLEEALTNAIEALQLHIEGMIDDGTEVPLPGPADAWPKWLGPKQKNISRAMIPAEVAAGPVRVNITLDGTLLARVDGAAEQLGMTRSGFLAQAAREKMEAPKPRRGRRRAA